jgi:hypothetical protein
VFEQDYVMRLIHEMIRAVLKFVFQIDMESATFELLENLEVKATLKKLYDMVEIGEVNEAENQIYEMTENLEQNALEVALFFYSYLNDKSDKFLEENRFSRDEVKQGVERVLSRYGLNEIVAMFSQ